MNVLGFFHKLRRQTSLDATDIGSSSNVSAQGHQCEDEEVDGYLLVGQTKRERTTVYNASLPIQGVPHIAPDYVQATHELPSYDRVLSGKCMEPNTDMFSRIELTPLSSQDSTPVRNQKSVISDVPFLLHPALAVYQQIGAMFNNVDLETHHFNWSKYSHDFIHEKLCLWDLNSNGTIIDDTFLFLEKPVKH